jgi:hypothetical protein
VEESLFNENLKVFKLSSSYEASFGELYPQRLNPQRLKQSKMDLYQNIILPVVLFLLIGIKIDRFTKRGLIERLGKYANFAQPDFNWINPIFDRIYLKGRDSRFGQ